MEKYRAELILNQSFLESGYTYSKDSLNWMFLVFENKWYSFKYSLNSEFKISFPIEISYTFTMNEVVTYLQKNTYYPVCKEYEGKTLGQIIFYNARTYSEASE